MLNHLFYKNALGTVTLEPDATVEMHIWCCCRSIWVLQLLITAPEACVALVPHKCYLEAPAYLGSTWPVRRI